MLQFFLGVVSIHNNWQLVLVNKGLIRLIVFIV